MPESNKKILIMEDEDIVADIARQMLIFMGFDVAVVEKGEDAIQSYQEAYRTGVPFSMVIMDLNIPCGMGGIEAVRHILDIDSSAKVLVSSGDSGDPIMIDFKKYGFRGCIAKPYDLNGLKTEVLKLINR